MDKFEIKTAFNRVKYDKKFDPGNMANVNDILCANPMQGVMEQIQDVIHESDLAHDNFIKECIVSVGIDPNALAETAKLNAKLQYELKTLRAEVDELIYKLECLLCHATGGKLSKHTYDIRTMELAVTDYINEVYSEGMTESARNIFYLIEDECLAYPIQEGHPTILVDASCYNELKKKYTEEN